MVFTTKRAAIIFSCIVVPLLVIFLLATSVHQNTQHLSYAESSKHTTPSIHEGFDLNEIGAKVDFNHRNISDQSTTAQKIKPDYVNFLPEMPEQHDYYQPIENKFLSKLKNQLNSLNLAKVKQDDISLVSMIRDNWILPPQRKAYNLENPHIQDYSAGQSGIIDNFLKRRRNGFFVECGALDGETRSNTLFLERERNWTGLLIEAGPINYRKLVKKNRNAYSTPACLSSKPYPNMVSFHRGQNRGRIIEGENDLDWVHNNNMKSLLTEVQCFPLFSLMLALGRTHIDYFSLDVEGIELEVLKTIPFHRLHIDILSVEFIHDSSGISPITTLMENSGYKHVATYTRKDNLANDLIFIKKPT